MEISDEKWLEWIDQMAEEDHVIIDDFLEESLYLKIKDFFDIKRADDAFQKASIGALSNNQIVNEIRGDYTYWLDPQQDHHLEDFFDLVENCKAIFNRYCFLSLSGYEFHLAFYPIGSFYKRHVDQFKDRSNRMITFILYFNETWEEGDGGELKIYLKDKSNKIIAPLRNRAVMFRSADLPHEVLPTHKGRASLTGWFLYQPPEVGYLFG